MAKLLFHICCAPCAIYPLQEVLTKEFDYIEGFYYNPNIYPLEEYLARRRSMEKFSRDAINRVSTGLKVIYPEYVPDEFKRTDCKACYSLRLSKTAQYAREHGFKAFTTTLLISPYQDQEAIRAIGNKLAKEYNLEFYDADFKKGFHASQAAAREKKLYRQKYCGCKHSLDSAK